MRSGAMKTDLDRRHFLRGLGACLALPAFEALSPVVAAVKGPAALATTASGAPLRMAFIYFPNGAHQEHWWPAEGEDFVLARTMQPLELVKHQLQVLGG